MPIILETSYAKRLGLPGYSSHQFSITLRTEITDLSQVQTESDRLYKLLQEGVDNSIKETGYLPSNPSGSNGHREGNGNGQASSAEKETWNCSEKQRALLLKIVEEQNLEKAKVEALAQERFSKGVRALDRLECSALLEELLEITGQSRGAGRGRFQGRYQRAGAR